MELKFSSKLKLNNKTLLDHVFTHGKKMSTARFAIFFCSNNLNFSRVGVIISRKNAKKAVDRNKFKRIVREAFRINQHRFSSCDLVVLAYREAGRLTKKELRECLEKQWIKLPTFSK